MATTSIIISIDHDGELDMEDVEASFNTVELDTFNEKNADAITGWSIFPAAADAPSAPALAILRDVDTKLAEWLIDNTEEVFEEQPEIDTARGMVQDAIELMEKGIPAEHLQALNDLLYHCYLLYYCYNNVPYFGGEVDTAAIGKKAEEAINYLKGIK